MCRSAHATVMSDHSALCPQGAAIYALAFQTGRIPAEAATDCIRRLGLLVADEAEPQSLRPVEAPIAVRLLAKAARDVAAGYQGTLNAVGEALAATTAGWRTGGGHDMVISHRRPEDVAHALDRAANACEERFLSALPATEVSEESLSAALRRRVRHADQGIQQRHLYPRSLRKDVGFSQCVETLAQSGVEIRTAVELSDGLTVCDDHTAFVSLAQGRSNTVLEIRHPLVANFVQRMFDKAWSYAEPWRFGNRRTTGTVGESGQLKDIVRLLISGKTDDAIGRHLGLSRRTVAAYVGRLSRELGSTSRAQLGFLIAKHGLLDH